MINKINTNSEFCGRVPLHQTNLVQPHGVLLIIENETGTVLQASENTEAVFGTPAADIVSNSLFQWLPSAGVQEWQSFISKPVLGKLPFTIEGANGQHLALAQQSEKYTLLEIEIQPQATGPGSSFLSVYQKVKKVMAALDACTTTEDICLVAAHELKALSGFDKVMAYRFDENWNGDVVAEEKEPGMDTYLGLKFPASDIPPQARELYKKSSYRLIPNTEYEPVRLYPVLNPLTNGFTDLSNSNLRSVAGVHLQYLRNMNIAASMSTRIMKKGQLWGLIACHHRTPFYLPFELCSVFELLSEYLAAKIEALPEGGIKEYQERSAVDLAELVEKLYTQNQLQRFSELLANLLAADGVAEVQNGRIFSTGQVPTDSQVHDLVSWLQAHNVEELYHQPSLASVYEEAEVYAATGSGLLALPVDVKKGHFILAFRGEVVQKISWGGNPEEALQFEKDGKSYHPRASFKIWQQTVRFTALPWKPEEREVAERVGRYLSGFAASKN